MQNLYCFERGNLLDFLKKEFRNRDRKNGFLGNIASFCQLFIFGIVNYQIQKSWYKTYKLIESSIIDFYPNLNFAYKGSKDDLNTFFQNKRYIQPFDCNFNKVHIAVTNISIYVFPFDSKTRSQYNSFYYNILNKPFQIIINKEKAPKFYTENTIVQVRSIEYQNNETIINFYLENDPNERKIFFGKIILFPSHL